MVSPTSASTDDRVVEAAEGGQPVSEGTGGEQPSLDTQMGAFMNAAIRGATAAGPAMSFGDQAADPTTAETPDGNAAPTGDVNLAGESLDGEAGPAADDPAHLPRRARPLKAALDEVTAERDRLRAERETELERVRAETRAAVLAEQQPRTESDPERYDRLIRTPDHQLQGDDYPWREEYKQKLVTLPEVEQHWQTVSQQAITSERNAFLAQQRADLNASLTLPGVDEAAVKGATSWADIARHYHEAGASTAADRLAAVEAENADLKLQLMGSLPRPVQPGRSSGDSGRNLSEGDFFNRLIRQAAAAPQ